jgi:pyruvate carboxylase subunit B
VAAEPLAWGKGHPEVEFVRSMLLADGFLVKDIDADAYAELKSMNQRCMTGFIDRGLQTAGTLSDADLLSCCKLPGGMIGSLMADMPDSLEAVNYALRSQSRPEITLSQLTKELLEEVEYIWPLLGCPPLVTPFSQYVKNTALMNILNLYKGLPRWTTVDKDTWNMILGRMGKLPDMVAPEIIQLASQKGLEFYDGNPQDLYPCELDRYREQMKANGWDFGADEEELLEFAMHERQYKAYKK